LKILFQHFSEETEEILSQDIQYSDWYSNWISLNTTVEQYTTASIVYGDVKWFRIESSRRLGVSNLKTNGSATES
jgi:hypothetical protein